MGKDYYALFAAHHRRLIGAIDNLAKRVEDDILNTPELLTYLWEALIPHARGEEVTLYKRAETLPGGHALVGPMIDEHETIVQRLGELGLLFERKEDAEFQKTLHFLLQLIHEHFQKEEGVLTPLLQQHLGPEEFGTLIEEAHRVERQAKPSDIQRFMGIDHQRINRLIELFSAHKGRDLTQATELVTRARAALLRHIRWEEELLFPAFEDKTHLRETGPTVVMRQEHVRIKAAVEQIVGMLESGMSAGLEAAEQELAGVLTVHNRKEETILYPMINKSLSASERSELLDKLV
jgi:iron-sulfur cluster repair protein YtfE (RIC family)